MIRLSEADGRPVLSRESAERLGRLMHVVVDASSRRITALHVAGRRRKAAMVGWDDITGFGPDGIVVDGDASLRPPGDDRERAVAGGDLDLDGRLVLDDRGDSQGALTDVVFDEESGEIGTFVCGEREIPAERLRAIGPFCVIVRAEPGSGE
ncbi:MAG TPA: PRC-barrel domain-containing protein [Miltoncostaeaceae bacterium]|nr:PRC-barrel domain-containing protein [Miltoncostaeaceae bacterium]